MNLGQIVQSHALSFFHLSGPDLLLGLGQRPGAAQRLRPDRGRARAGTRRHPTAAVRPGDHRGLGGKKIHPAWAVPGGVRGTAAPRTRDRSCAARPRSPATVQRRPGPLQAAAGQAIAKRSQTFGNFPTLFLGLVAPDGSWEHYDGRLRFVDADGQIVADGFEPADYRATSSAKRSQRDSYLKSPYYRPLGYPEGIYRVGPLARLNICDRIGTPLADQELVEYRQRGGGTATHRSISTTPGSSKCWRRSRSIEQIAGRSRPAFDAFAGRGGGQQPGRRRLSARRRAAPCSTITRWTNNGLLQEGQPDHRHGSEQPGDEPDGCRRSPSTTSGPARSRRACSTASKPASAPSIRA